MNSYVIFIKGDESKVIIKSQVTRQMSKSLKANGFTRYPHTIDADNENNALKILNKQGQEHLNALSEFTENIFFYCAVLVISLVVALILSR
ncbi:hypothetical protein [Enterobacter soli]|uniref:hypothetical protein n=1 Tax=Enterobacter soli TaxID=885040 RepID=UPI0034CE2525